MEVLYAFQQLTLIWSLFNLSLPSVCTFRCFGSDPKYFETISAHEREVDGGKVYRQLNEKPQIDRNLSFITGILAFIACSDFRYNSDCACAAHLLPSQ